MEFLGKGLLLDVSVYEGKDKNHPDQPAKTKYKYVFLVGDQKDSKSFVSDPHVESYISDRVLLCGDEKVFTPIDIKLTINSFYTKVNGSVTRVEKPQYVVVDKVGG